MEQSNDYSIKMMGINVTYKCNLNCYMCGQRKNPNLNFKEELDFDLIKKTVLEAKKHGLRLGVYIWGGEPFLYSRIDELIEFLDEQKIFITINTNGVLLDKHMDTLLKCKNFVRLIISIDGIGAVHDEIRGIPGTFDRLAANIKYIVANRKNRIMISTNTVITSLNYRNLSSVIDQISLLGVDYLECQLPIFITDQMGAAYESRMRGCLNVDAKSWKSFQGNYYDIDIDVLKEQLSVIMEKHRRKFKLNPDLKDENIDLYFKDPESIYPERRCSLPFSQVHLEPNGNVVVCPDFPDCIVGNIYQSSLDEIWNSEKNEKFREMIKQESLSICSRCCQFYQF